MGLNFGEKLNAAKQKMGDVKKSVGENMADFKQKNAENKAEREPQKSLKLQYLMSAHKEEVFA